jgi:hypothetical protein
MSDDKRDAALQAILDLAEARLRNPIGDRWAKYDLQEIARIALEVLSSGAGTTAE